MHLISVNIGQAQSIGAGKKSGTSGIVKLPVEGPVWITREGVSGDVVVDRKHHGGPDQAVYVYGTGDYDWWAEALGRALTPGTFGENLTIAELESARFSVGDRLSVGEVVLEVSAARIPCSTLAARMGDPGFAKLFRLAERPGLYCRVIQPGTVREGAAVTVEPHSAPTVTILEMYREYYNPDQDETSIRRHLAAPIAIRARAEQEERLQKLLKKSSPRS